MDCFKEELNRIFSQSEKPSEFFRQLSMSVDFPVKCPELYSLIGLKQNPRYHAEGDVWTHTLMVLDAAALFRDKVNKPLPFMLSALCHDFGKSVCSEETNGIIHSYGHEEKGLPLAEKFLSRFGFSKDVISYVLNMVKLHMKPNTIAVNNSSVKASNNMFSEAFFPLDLIYLAAADSLGQIPNGNAEQNIDFLMQRLKIYNDIIAEPFFTEKDLIRFGFEDERILNDSMIYARKLRLSCVKTQDNFKQTLAYARSLQKKMEKSLY